ncbi:MAG: hypothetical protein QOF41_1017 [Methylobacteriaceae bacterium]|nr:hypothetical protein [Methylobacteriaceae bacterium]
MQGAAHGFFGFTGLVCGRVRRSAWLNCGGACVFAASRSFSAVESKPDLIADEVTFIMRVKKYGVIELTYTIPAGEIVS